MFKNRLFNILIGIALVTLVALTAREDFAITSITSQTDTSIKCSSLPSRFSIRTGHVNESALDIGKGFVDGNESFFTFIELYIQN